MEHFTILRVPPKPVPAFRVEGVSFCGKDLIIEMEDSVYRGDMSRFAAKVKK
jgi:GntR family transcriptional regulator